MTIHIELEAEEERALLERARLNGCDPARYARQIIQNHILSQPHEADSAKIAVDELIDHNFVAACARTNGESVPTIEEVRRILARVPGSLAEDIIADREDRF